MQPGVMASISTFGMRVMVALKRDLLAAATKRAGLDAI